MKKFAIITLHNKNSDNLITTCKSIDNQILYPDLHIVISKTSFYNPSLLFKGFRKIILCKDKSLYNAMNLAIKFTENFYINFLNSGDTLENIFIIQNIKKNIIMNYKRKCLQLKTKLYDGINYYNPKKKYFFNDKYLIHPSFVRPNLRMPRERIMFNEKLPFYADVYWMKKNKDLFGVKKMNINHAIHKLGGVSTNPNLKTILDYSKNSYFLSFKETIKCLIKFFFKKKYFLIIYSLKFRVSK